MVYDASLGQAMVQFTESLNMRPAPSVEKNGEDLAREAKAPDQGAVIVTISEAARALIAPEKSGNSADSRQNNEEEKQDQLIRQLKQRIEELEAEVEELEKRYDLSEEKKTQQIQDRQAQLMELRDQLMKAELAKLKAAGFTEGGGTRARGFGNSAGSF